MEGEDGEGPDEVSIVMEDRNVFCYDVIDMHTCRVLRA